MSEDQSDSLHVAMQLIVAAGNAKNAAMQAIQAAKKNNFKQANSYLHQANNNLNEAHLIQKEMLTQEAKGKHVQVDLYLIHAQDHLMTAITFIDLAKEIVDLYRKLAIKK